MNPFRRRIEAGSAGGAQPPRLRPYTIRRETTPVDHLRPQRWSWELLLRPLDQSLARSVEEPLSRSRLLGLRFFWLDGLFATISDNFYITFVPLFALVYGASNTMIGLLTAITNLLGTAALFPGAKMVETVGLRKPIVVATGGVIGRLALVFLVVIPLLTRSTTLAIAVIIAVSSLRSFMGNFGNPAWTSLTADLVPASIRGRYFTHKNQAMGIAALVVAPVAGWMIHWGDHRFGLPHFGYQLIFFLALLFGMVSTYCYASIPEPEHGGGRPLAHKRGDLRKAIRNSPSFLWFVVSAFVWNLAIQVAAPFFNVYLITNLHGTVSLVGLAAGATSLFTLFGQSLFGRLIDSKSNLWVERVSGIMIPLLPLMWVVVRTPWEVLAVNAFSGFVWAGFNMANFNLLLELTPAGQRARAVALYQTVVFAAAVIGPMAGGYLSEVFGFAWVFALSAAGRFGGIAILFARVSTEQGKGRPRAQ